MKTQSTFDEEVKELIRTLEGLKHNIDAQLSKLYTKIESLNSKRKEEDG